MPKKTIKCKKCDKTFSRPGPFAWHMQSMHGAKKKTAKKAKRRGKKRTMKRAGRKGSTSRLGLKTMSLEQLTQLIYAARHEARSRLADLEASIG